MIFIMTATLLTMCLLLPVSGLAANEDQESSTSKAYSTSFQAGESMAPTRWPALRHAPYTSTLRVLPPVEWVLQQQGLMAQQATISVNFLPSGVVGDDICTTWPSPAKTAFSYAASLWASQLQSPIPITIDACWANNLSAGVLGHGGPNALWRDFSGAPIANTWYVVSAANALHGSDLDPDNSDIYGAYSNTFNWYFGTDGNTPPNQVDFVSVVLHEIAHGLGFLGSMQVSSGVGSWGFGTSFLYPSIYDRFTQNGFGQKLLDTTLFPNPSSTLFDQLIGGDIYFNGPNANVGNGGAPVPLYAPSIWQAGSSYAHLAESYNDTSNALMTYSLANGESIHSPGPVTLGLLKDVGWALQSVSASKLLLAGLTASGQVYYTTNLSAWIQIPGQAMSSLQMGDMNRDGQNDLIGLTASNHIYYTTNLSTWTQIPGGLSRVVVGDFSGEGQADLAGVAGDDTIWYTTNLSSWTRIPGKLVRLVAGDLDGNGRSDLAGLASDETIWYTTDLSSWTRISGKLVRLVAGDFDGNGRSDLAGLASDETIWYTTDLSSWTRISGKLVRLVAGDFDGNGRSDLAGVADDGTIWYTTNLSSWIQSPGQLDRLAGDD